MVESEKSTALRSFVVFAVVLGAPICLFAALRIIDEALGSTVTARLKLPEMIFALGMSWKLLVYPHDVLLWRGVALFPRHLAPAFAILQWTVISVVVIWRIRRRSLLVQAAAAVATVLFVGIALLGFAWLSGATLPPFE